MNHEIYRLILKVTIKKVKKGQVIATYFFTIGQYELLCKISSLLFKNSTLIFFLLLFLEVGGSGPKQQITDLLGLHIKLSA